MDVVRVDINGAEIQARPGQTILEVVEEHDLDEIPTLCYAPELEPFGSCFLCVVEVEGRPNLLPSCATRVQEGMKIKTRSERVLRSRRTALELLLSNHYADCVSPCNLGCPAGVDAQGYIALAAMGQYRRAVELVREANPLPAICGRICVRKCEIVCRRQEVDEPVAINFIKRYVTDMPGTYDRNPTREPGRAESVGIVGGGPAGLTAAWFLGKKGYDCCIYEAMKKPGGMLRYGIPEYRLPKAVLDREIEYITRVGVQIQCNVRVGTDVSLADLMSRHDAVFLAPGAMGGKAMRVEGEHDTEGVVTGVEYLIEKAEYPDPVSGTVVVVGGGNTAMDAARTPWRLGADKVIVLYRRTKAEMPADRLEIEDCLKEGIEIMELAAPVGIVTDGGKLKALQCIRMKLGEPDESGRRRPIPLEGSEFELPCDLAVSAIGQTPLLDEILETAGPKPDLTRWNTFVVEPGSMRTRVKGLFAGGDAADDGPTIVIDAVRDGRRAARAIHSYLSGEETPREPFRVTKDFWAKPGTRELGDVKESPRHTMRELPVEERAGSFREVALGFEYEDVVHESDRCLSCGCLAFDDCKLRLYAEAYGVDMDRFKGNVRKHKIDDRHPYIVYDPNKCILCCRCIRTCSRVLPIAALSLVNRGFQAEMRPAMNDPLVETSCISCGNCVDACPTGALLVKYPFPGRACLRAERVESHCGFCSLCCPVTVKRISDDRYFMEGSGKPGEYLCHYGRFGNELFIRERRLVRPALREGGYHKTVSFRDAYHAAARGLQAAVDRHGPEGVGVFVSPELSNEEMYLAGRIAREGLGTNNIGSISLLCSGVESAALDAQLGFTASTSDRTAIRDADLIVCSNADPQADQLILSVEIIEAVRTGARLVVVDSSVNSLESLASLILDPMRGRAALLWCGIVQALLEGGFLDREGILNLPGGAAFLAGLSPAAPGAAADATGVVEEKIRSAAERIGTARKAVFIHSPDRFRDLARGDLQILADLLICLRAKGTRADLILPYAASNAAGIELAGADPAFRAGRVPSRGLPGAGSREDLLHMLEKGGIRAALVVGEDPMQDDRTASYFRDVDFMVSVDWAQTETTMFADVSIPGSTVLESEGTRCNFEGSIRKFVPAVYPVSGVKGWQVLRNLGDHLDMELPAVFSRLSGAVAAAAREGLGDFLPFYFNTGERRPWDGRGRLVVPPAGRAPSTAVPALTAIAQYKRRVREVGIQHFRVGARD